MIRDILVLMTIVFSIIFGLLLLTTRERIWRIGVLAGIFMVQFMTISFGASLLISLTLLILGWMSCAVLGAGRANPVEDETIPGRTEAVFRAIAYLFFLGAAWFLAQKSSVLLPNLDPATAFLGIGIAFTGLTSVGFMRPYYNSIFGLMLILAGFEIVYYSLEMSLLVVALLGAVKLGLAFIGSYWYLQYQEQIA
jgi:hypothetical protein